MNILFIRLIDAYIDPDVKETFENIGCKVKEIDKRTFFDNYRDLQEDPGIDLWLSEELTLNDFDAVYTTNFFPGVARGCYKAGVIYLSWYYDTPPIMDSREEVTYPTNRLFFFNEKDYLDYRLRGIENVFFLPLAVNTKRLLYVLENNRKQYAAQVSLVGNLYHSVYPGLRGVFSTYMQGYLDGIVGVQTQLFSDYIVQELISDEIEIKMTEEYYNGVERNKELNKRRIAYAISTWITYRDRVSLLGMCGKMYDTKLYTTEIEQKDKELLAGVDICGSVDYMMEMPLVFAHSKINLCPILRINRNGIPLRALDIMGCGGLLLADYQPELEKRFKQGEEMLMYHSIPEAMEIIEYYLRHENERERIAANGRSKICEEYQYVDRIKKILDQLN